VREEIYRRKKGVVHRKILDEYILVDTREGEVLTLNEVGGEIWDLIDGRRSVAEIIRMLVEQYEVSEEDAEGDVEEFLTQLLEAGLIERVK